MSAKVSSFNAARGDKELSPEQVIYTVLEDMHAGKLDPDVLIVATITKKEGGGITTNTFRSGGEITDIVAACELAKDIFLGR